MWSTFCKYFRLHTDDYLKDYTPQELDKMCEDFYQRQQQVLESMKIDISSY